MDAPRARKHDDGRSSVAPLGATEEKRGSASSGRLVQHDTRPMWEAATAVMCNSSSRPADVAKLPHASCRVTWLSGACARGACAAWTGTSPSDRRRTARLLSIRSVSAQSAWPDLGTDTDHPAERTLEFVSARIAIMFVVADTNADPGPETPLARNCRTANRLAHGARRTPTRFRRGRGACQGCRRSVGRA